MDDLSAQYLTTKELADLLRIKERKVYDLVASGDVPCSRATGKLLFPKADINAWISHHGSGYSATPAKSVPNIILGSHDPLLDWAIRESQCGLATFYDGSIDGLKRIANGEGVVSGLHVFDGETQSWNLSSVEAHCANKNVALVEFAWRERGFILSNSLDVKLETIHDLTTLRVARRQPGAGAQSLLEFELAQNGISAADISYDYLARTETDAAVAVATGEADVAFGLRSVAKQHQLRFIPVTEERYDLLVDRAAWFEPPMQTLIQFCTSKTFKKKAKDVTGYDCSNFGVVHFNSVFR